MWRWIIQFYWSHTRQSNEFVDEDFVLYRQEHFIITLHLTAFKTLNIQQELVSTRLEVCGALRKNCLWSNYAKSSVSEFVLLPRRSNLKDSEVTLGLVFISRILTSEENLTKTNLSHINNHLFLFPKQFQRASPKIQRFEYSVGRHSAWLRFPESSSCFESSFLFRGVFLRARTVN